MALKAKKRGQAETLIVAALSPQSSFQFRTPYSLDECENALYKQQTPETLTMWQQIFGRSTTTTVTISRRPAQTADFQVKIVETGRTDVKITLMGTLKALEDGATLAQGEIRFPSLFAWLLFAALWTAAGIIVFETAFMTFVGLLLVVYSFAYNYYQKSRKVKYIEAVLGFERKVKG